MRVGPKRAHPNSIWVIPMASTSSSRMSGIVEEPARWATCVSRPSRRLPKDCSRYAISSHFTLGVPDRQRSTAFYQNVFGMPVQTHQGAAILLAVGASRQFITMGGVNGALQGVPNI